jgi:hypothetical protein
MIFPFETVRARVSALARQPAGFFLVQRATARDDCGVALRMPASGADGRFRAIGLTTESLEWDSPQPQPNPRLEYPDRSNFVGLPHCHEWLDRPVPAIQLKAEGQVRRDDFRGTFHHLRFGEENSGGRLY